MPTLTISTPATINSVTISAVTTFPAIMVASGRRFSLKCLIASMKLIVYPFATSNPTNATSGKVVTTPDNSKSSLFDIPDITQSLSLRSACFHFLPSLL